MVLVTSQETDLAGGDGFFKEGQQNKKYTIANGVLDSDGVISLPKMKTHVPDFDVNREPVKIFSPSSSMNAIKNASRMQMRKMYSLLWLPGTLS